ncbi:MAG TPA: winged helix DNA-binding domain-containing protein [Gemmataceae bacterium]|nr:winged helix DNA-binding domain-containing protein [Gemmataceae bacterium]
MKSSDLAQLRLRNQRIAGKKFTKPEEVVAYFGAMQAQDYLGALWAIGLRMEQATEKAIEKALADRKIIRMWPMRRTLHVVACEDAWWMHALMTPGLLKNMGQRGERFYGLTSPVLERCRNLVTKALTGDKQMTRAQLYEALEKGGVRIRGDGRPLSTVPSDDPFLSTTSRGLHILVHLAHEGLICFGSRAGKQQTFVLFQEWVPKTKSIPREQALEELVVRYFTSHGPATVHDLMWWSGLPGRDIKKGIELAGVRLEQLEIEGKTYYCGNGTGKLAKTRKRVDLLPPFDEYIVAYRDRSAVMETRHNRLINPGGNGMLSAVIVSNGRVIGGWKRTITKSGVTITPKWFTKPTLEERKSFENSVAGYSAFLMNVV